MSDASASSGGRLGRYHLVEPMGGGPNGEVYRAKVYGVAGFERQFAVKKFFPQVALNTRYAQALAGAARAYGSLEHPRIARLAEFGVSSGHTFTATELAPGLDAARLLVETLAAGHTIAPGAALALVSQAARAVGYAHGRGIAHLGVAPTNLIVAPDGEVKITDIGILGACLPERPAQDGRFSTRVHYLAPEQLTGEPTSSATDVFALGLLAYELVTGERAFVGVTADDVAQAILTGQPREPKLPRPIMRVLQRCLARSPYERFPDARALADALDAAVRVSPVPGTRGDVAELAVAALHRISTLHDQQASGMLSLSLPTSGRLETVNERPTPADQHDAPTVPFRRESDSTFPELASQPASTLQGMAPPPIPVPTGVAPPPVPPPAPLPSTTLHGMAPVRLPPPRPTTAVPPPIPRPVTSRSDITDAQPAPPAMVAGPPATRMPPPPTPPPPIAGPGSSGQMPPVPDRFATSDPTNDVARRLDTIDSTAAPGSPLLDRRLTTGEPVAPLDLLGRASPAGGVPAMRGERGHPGATSTLEVHTHDRRGSRKAVIAAVAVLATAGGAFVGWQLLGGEDTGAPPAAPGSARPSAQPGSDRPGSGTAAAVAHPDAAPVAAAPADARAGSAASGDAAPVAAAPADARAGSAAPGDAAPVAAVTVDAAGSAGAPPSADAAPAAVSAGDKLVIASQPPGARAFIDGADQGQTPITLPGSADRHSLALVLDGYAPYIAETDGHGAFTIKLDEVTPSGGPAGIKVKCKERGRYVVFLDGKPTGQMCPTERLEVEMGEHLVEVYDLVTETRRQYPANVKETRLSFRIRLD